MLDYNTSLFTLPVVYPVTNCTSLQAKHWAQSDWRYSPAFYTVPKKYRTGPKSTQTPVPFLPPTGRNPDWSITMICMQLTTQLIHYHVLICIIICYRPKGNIIILLSPLELKSDFISIEKLLSGVDCHHFISYERPSLQVKRELHILFRNWLFIMMAAVYCLPKFLLHMTILKIFWKLDSIRPEYTASNRK